ncbi:MAG: sugar ABC transporter ATP-binding protein, partial [Clostridia bacterium]|nr:sugar ABC transporter ATP-binding protein [Clostridia bacterium]
DEIFTIADRITVLRDGTLIKCGDINEFDNASLINLMVGRELRFVPFHNAGGFGDTLFEVKNLTCEPHFRNVSFDVRRGEILGITGLVGAGRSEVAQTIFGLLKAQEGEVILNGETVKVKNVQDAIRQGICYLPEDRREQGLFMPQTMRVNTTTASMKKILTKIGLISGKKELQTAKDYIKSLDIRPANPELRAANFSGGNQQKVLVARWLNASPKLLIVDEVTSGVDVGVKTEIHKLLRELAESGVAVVVISSDLPEILAVSDRIAVMAYGKITAIMDVEDATQEKVLEKSIIVEEG